jgi:hypothetical protein
VSGQLSGFFLVSREDSPRHATVLIHCVHGEGGLGPSGPRPALAPMGTKKRAADDRCSFLETLKNRLCAGDLFGLDVVLLEHVVKGRATDAQIKSGLGEISFVTIEGFLNHFFFKGFARLF